MRAFIFAAGDKFAAQADFNNHSQTETVLSAVGHDVDFTEYRRCDNKLAPHQPGFSVQHVNGPPMTMHVIFAIYA
jgi:hypothetical protein